MIEDLLAPATKRDEVRDEGERRCAAQLASSVAMADC
jgi:hypothetical protein